MPRNDVGGGIFTGRYGTNALSFEAGTPVFFHPVRVWDRYADSSNDPQLSYWSFSTQLSEALIKRIYWEEGQRPKNVQFRVSARVDEAAPWEATMRNQIWLSRDTQAEGRDTDGEGRSIRPGDRRTMETDDPRKFLYFNGFGGFPSLYMRAFPIALGSPNDLATSGSFCSVHSVNQITRGAFLETHDSKYSNYVIMAGRSSLLCGHADGESRADAEAISERGMRLIKVDPRNSNIFRNGDWANFAKRRAISVFPTPVGPIIIIFFGAISSRSSGSSCCRRQRLRRAIATERLAFCCPMIYLSSSSTISEGFKSLITLNYHLSSHKCSKELIGSRFRVQGLPA